MIDLNQTWETTFTENCSNQAFPATDIPYISIKSLRKTLNLYKNQVIQV